MRIYRIVKKEESPTILIGRVNFSEGFIIVTSDGEAIGIIVEDKGQEEYIFITKFSDYFTSELEPQASSNILEDLMKEIKSEYTDPVEFNFIKVVE